jgi:hypothetical protein
MHFSMLNPFVLLRNFRFQRQGWGYSLPALRFACDGFSPLSAPRRAKLSTALRKIQDYSIQTEKMSNFAHVSDYSGDDREGGTIF